MSSYAYTYDGHGRVATATTPEGSFHYQYDALSRLGDEQQYSGANLVAETRRTYDAAGNLATSTNLAGATTTYHYDADDRLLSATSPSGTTTYTYNGRGALSQIQAPTGTTLFTYDDLDQLLSVTQPGGQQVSYAYDGLGRRLSRTDATGTRRCLPLPATPLGNDDCALTYATTGAEQPQALVFGPLGPASAHGAAQRYALTAGSSSVVGVTDGTGSVVGTAGYDAWGVPIAKTGESLGYGYAGERQDPLTGLVFLRARWYAPAIGRFLTPDRYGATSEDPRTVHRYAYVSSNPLNHVDPTGLQSMGEISVAADLDGLIEDAESAAEKCVYEKMKGVVLTLVKDWAINKVKKGVFDTIAKATFGLAAGTLTYEIDFHESLAKILCGTGDTEVTGLFDFEVSVDTCGVRKERKTVHGTGGLGFAALSDCLSGLFTQNGIDIVFADLLGIELKVSKDTFKAPQLQRYCRFGAQAGIHTFMYAFVNLPDISYLKDYANQCWNCWNPDGGCKPPDLGVGSIYVAVGVNAPSGQSQVFVAPQPNTVCAGGAK